VSSANSTGDERDRPPAETPRSEWIVAVFSLLLVLGAIGYLVYDTLTSPRLPADIRVSADTVIDGQGNYIVRFAARNVGGSTGASVLIAGELHPATNDSSIERSTATLRFIPGNSTRRGGLFFTHDPRTYRLVLRAEGFSAP
jgi:uncharacterized protein (TIGR02588 family)